MGGQESSLHHIQAGVPQGSTLGPALFLRYVNFCENTLPAGAELGTYADDTTLAYLLYMPWGVGHSRQSGNSRHCEFATIFELSTFFFRVAAVVRKWANQRVLTWDIR